MCKGTEAGRAVGVSGCAHGTWWVGRCWESSKGAEGEASWAVCCVQAVQLWMVFYRRVTEMDAFPQ